MATKHYFLKEQELGGFVDKMMAALPVIAPVARKNKFAFEQLEASEDLRLDYDVTLLPPKETFFPMRQDLVTFSPDGCKGCIDPKPQVLFGVHFYDIKAIDQTDLLFTENKPDNNYLANRKATTLVGSSIQSVSKRAFWASVGKESKAKGHDAFLTKIEGGYHFETLTDKGEALIAHGSFSEASEAQISQAKQVNEGVLDKCPEALKHDSAAIAEKTRSQFKNTELWNKMADQCFSCGTCNIVCPTCYCFDVQDKWNLDQVSGSRYRQWDGCLLQDFSQVSLGGGATENFREQRGERFRHRIMRKATYLNRRLGGPACVGCGRCSAGCVPDIADPVHAIEKIMEA